MRTTRREIDGLVAILANRLGRPSQKNDGLGYVDATGYHVRVGALFADYAPVYGGYSLREIVNEGGGEHEWLTRRPAREFADTLRAMLKYGELQERSPMAAR